MMIEVLVICLVLAFVYYEINKRKQKRLKHDYYHLRAVSDEGLQAWLPVADFEILKRFEVYQLSEASEGSYQGFDFIVFLLSCSLQEGQCLRQTVTAIRLKSAVSPFVRQEGDLWLECNGEVLLVYKEKQSMTCGSPLELFLGRALCMLKVYA